MQTTLWVLKIYSAISECLATIPPVQIVIALHSTKQWKVVVYLFYVITRPCIIDITSHVFLNIICFVKMFHFV